jgi:GET complex subunit GET2
MESSPAPEDESPAQRQARLRRERRKAKVESGGADRLAKITGISGRKVPEPEPKRPASGKHSSSLFTPGCMANHITIAASTSSEVPDPDHMDISHLPPQWRGPPQANPFGSDFQPDPEDPMLKMMQQLLSGSGAMDPNNPDALPPSLASFFPGMPMPGSTQAQQQQVEPQAPTVSAVTWRIVHAVISLALALFVTLSSPVPFTGSKASRELADLGGVGTEFGARLFFWFASVEVVLQSSRFFMERGQLQSGGILGTAARILPEPWAGYVRVVGRYGTIFGTVVSDALVVVFALGCVAWWNGGLG